MGGEGEKKGAPSSAKEDRTMKSKEARGGGFKKKKPTVLRTRRQKTGTRKGKKGLETGPTPA